MKKVFLLIAFAISIIILNNNLTKENVQIAKEVTYYFIGDEIELVDNIANIKGIDLNLP